MSYLFNSALQIWHRFTITRYLVASVVALALDVAVFSVLRTIGMYAGIAGAIGYCAGIVVHWLISASFVFTGRAKTGNASYVQRALFAGSALLGLGITIITISVLSSLGFNAMYAKTFAVALSFFAVYAVREFSVFV